MNSESFSAFKKDLVCGSFAGLIVCITGHPLDSMKVRMQTAHVSFLGIIGQTYKHEGLAGFYKGVGPPLITVPLINSIVFASYELCKRLLGVRSQEEFTFN